jgi:hypothetical protein
MNGMIDSTFMPSVITPTQLSPQCVQRILAISAEGFIAL